MPLGIDVVEPPLMLELQKLGVEVRDAQQTMLAAREEACLLGAHTETQRNQSEDSTPAVPRFPGPAFWRGFDVSRFTLGLDCEQQCKAVSPSKCALSVRSSAIQSNRIME
jgi:hypothetical protein